ANQNLGALDISHATHIPWAEINANTSGFGRGANFSGLDLGNWSPAPATRISGNNYTNATNLPWAALNATTAMNHFSGSNFTNVDLGGWNPTGKTITNITYT